MLWIFAIATLALVVFSGLILVLTRYKRCPSDKVLVKYGKVGKSAAGEGLSSKCIHGGATFIWPIFQDYGFLDLTPITIDIDLSDALSKENIRVSTPSTYTIGISTEPGVMENAAERLLGETLEDIRNLAQDIIFGQMRVVIATMQIEEINADRDRFIENISAGLEPELEKVGLRLINVNIKDVNDKSGFIDALGREAAARAINDAKKKVAQQERDGEVGKAEAEREKRIRVAQADAEAVEGENKSKVQIANSNSERRQEEAEAERKAVAAEKVNAAQAKEEAYAAEREAEVARAKREEATQRANTVVPAKIEKERIETLAEAEAEEERRERQGEADGLLSVMQAKAEGLKAQLVKKAEGFDAIVKASGNNPEMASLMMITEQMPELVKEQVKTISDLKFDSITVWENGNGQNGNSSTANFLSGLIGSLPPLHELTENVGIKLPDYLGEITNGDPEQLDQLGDALKERASSRQEALEEVRVWMKEHQSELSSAGVDRDRDSMDVARSALKLAERSGQGEVEWLYQQDNEWKGPLAFEEIEEAVSGDPYTLVTTEEAETSLPYRLVEVALDEIEKTKAAAQA